MLHTYSFPSGHASSIVGAMGVAVVLTRMLVRRPGVRRLVLGLSLAMSCSSAPTGSSSGVHNVSDVVAGYLLGQG